MGKTTEMKSAVQGTGTDFFICKKNQICDNVDCADLTILPPRLLPCPASFMCS